MSNQTVTHPTLKSHQQTKGFITEISAIFSRCRLTCRFDSVLVSMGLEYSTLNVVFKMFKEKYLF